MKVSVIVPVYGVEKYIARCAESLMGQSYPDIQFIFVNDGTKDRSMEVLAGVLERFPDREVRIVNQENAGLPRARAAGMRLAEGDYILHVDSDDWVEKDMVEALVACAGETGADVVYFDYWQEYPDHSRPHPNGAYTAATRERFIQDIFRYRTPGYVWNKFARRSLYDGLSWPAWQMNEDSVTMAQVLYRSTRIHHLERFLYHYRKMDSHSLSSQPKAARNIQATRNFLDFYVHFSGEGPAACVREDILLRSAWMAWRYDRSLFRDYPFLRDEAVRIPLRRNRALKPWCQLELKYALRFKVR